VYLDLFARTDWLADMLKDTVKEGVAAAEANPSTASPRATLRHAGRCRWRASRSFGFAT